MTDDLRYERFVDAPCEVVFDAFTSAGGQIAFYGRDDPGWIVRSESELRIGGAWTVVFGPSPERLYRHRHLFEVIDRRDACCSRQRRRGWMARRCGSKLSSPSKAATTGR